MQRCREGTLAIYRQTLKGSTATRYEVIRIREAPAVTWPDGRVTPAREVYPGTTRWGVDGFTCHSLDEAKGLLADLRTAQDA